MADKTSKQAPRRWRRYRCKHCGQTFLRLSNKSWIKSYCSTAERYVRLVWVRR